MEYSKYKVCVRCFTFNQAKFIEETMLEVIKKRALPSCYSLARIEFSSEGRQDALKGIVDVVMEGIFWR